MHAKPNLDFMRSVAVLLVVIDHTALALRIHHIGFLDPAWLGTFGVFIFFVHTSLVLMWSLERKPHTLDFYIRRIFRIYPLALLAIAVALLTHAPLAGNVAHYFGRTPLSAKDVLAHCLLVQNLRPGTPPLVNVMWTLPLEVDMYLLLPALFFFARSNFSPWPFLLIWGLFNAFCRVSFDPNAVNLATVLPMFIPGVVAYIGFGRRWKAVLPSWTFALFLALLVTWAMRHPSNRTGWTFNLALGLLLPFFQQFRARWLVRLSHHIAKYSYGIYLSHPFALVAGVYLLPNHSVWVQLAVELTIIVASSVAAYHLLEKPMIDLGSRLAAAAERRYEQVAAPERAPALQTGQ